MKSKMWFGNLGSVFLGLIIFVAPAFAVVERVILISIDGIRNSEGFGDADCQGLVEDGNCLLTNLKTLVDDGTLYTSEPPITTTKGSAFLVNAAPWTTPGHTMLLTGVRDVEPNIGETVDLRPFRPTIFERLRKQLSWNVDQVVAVVSKDNTRQLEYSTDLAHGQGLGATLYRVIPNTAGAPAEEDVRVAKSGQCLMQGKLPTSDFIACSTTNATKPDFLFLHFGGVDREGHENSGALPNQGDYANAIFQVDAQIFNKIWCEMGPTLWPGCPSGGTNQDFRRDNTVLIITTDHGRESFTVKSHGGLDWGNRAIFLLGIGPGIPAGQIFTNNPTGTGCKRRSDNVAFPCRQQEDLAPTIASMLAPTYTVTVPDAEGVVMDELLTFLAGPPTPRFPLQRTESRVVASQGKLHVVWSERDQTTGERVINYQQVDPTGLTSFTIPLPSPPNPPVITLSQPTDAEGRRLTASQPYIFATGPAVNVVYSVTRSVQDSTNVLGEGGRNVADIYVVRSQNGGSNWGAPERVVQSVVEDNSTTPVTCMKAYFAPATVLEMSPDKKTLRRWVFTMRLSTEVLGFYQDQVTGPWTEVDPPIVPPAQQCPSTLDNLEIPAAGGEIPGPGYMAQRPDATVEGQNVELVWQAVGTDNRWDVFRAENTSFAFPDQWTVTNVSSITDGKTAYVPGVSLQGNTLNVLWADDAEAGPVWRVRGNQATAPVSGSNAFLPDAVPRSASEVYAVYSRIVDPINTINYDIFWNKSTDSGVLWPNEAPLPVTSPDPSLYPSVTWDTQGQSAWVVWREGNGPNWVIKGQLIE